MKCGECSGRGWNWLGYMEAYVGCETETCFGCGGLGTVVSTEIAVLTACPRHLDFFGAALPGCRFCQSPVLAATMTRGGAFAHEYSFPLRPEDRIDALRYFAAVFERIERIRRSGPKYTTLDDIRRAVRDIDPGGTVSNRGGFELHVAARTRHIVKVAYAVERLRPLGVLVTYEGT